MHSLLAVAAAILLAVLVRDGLIWVGLALLAVGALPALAALRARPSALGLPPRAGAVVLHLGSLVAQTGLIVTLIALIPG